MEPGEESTWMLIEDYLDGHLDQAAVHAFEQRMQRDAELSKQVRLARLAQVAVEKAYHQELRQRIQPWLDDPPPTNPKRRLRIWLFLVVLATGLGFLLTWVHSRWHTQPPPDPNVQQNLIADSLLKSPNKTDTVFSFPTPKDPSKRREMAETAPDQPRQPDQPKGEIVVSPPVSILTPVPPSPEQIATRVEQARKAYTDPPDRSTKAANLSDTIVESVRYSPVIRDQMLADTLFKAGKYAQAAVIFRRLKSSEQVGEDAQWNLAMCYLAQYPARQGSFRREMTAMIGNDNHTYQRRAKALRVWLAQ